MRNFLKDCGRRWNKVMAGVFALSFTIVLVSCSKGDGGVKAPFKPVEKTTVKQYKVMPTGGQLTTEYIGETTFNGKSVEQYRVTYSENGSNKVVDVYGEYYGNGKIDIAGFSVVEGFTTDYTVTFDEVVSLDESRFRVGKQQELTVSGSVQAGDNFPISVSGTTRFEKTSEDETVETELGVLSGVHIFEGEAIIDKVEGVEAPVLLNLFVGVRANYEIWYHPTFGILKVEVPELGFGTTLLGEYDCGNPQASDYNTIQKIGIVSSENPSFVLSSYDCSGDFDADGERHAKMYLELRWADEDKAKTSEKPEVEVSFKTVWGYFPFQLVKSSVSIFHPEENEEGFTYWYAYVDQAAGRDWPELYEIVVNFPNHMNDPVRVTARIRYPIRR